MRFFSEFALLARDLHDAADLYRAELRADQGSFVIDPVRLTRYLNQTEAQIDSMIGQAATRDDVLEGYLERLQRLGIRTDLPIARADTETEERGDDMGAVQPLDMEMIKSFFEEDVENRRDCPKTPSRSQTRLSLSSLQNDVNILKSPEMPSISSHSQAIMSKRYHTEDFDPLEPFSASIAKSDFDKVPGFLRSRVTLEDVNSVLNHVSIGDSITPRHLETELGFGSKAKALIMILQQLNRARASCSRDGEVVYEIIT